MMVLNYFSRGDDLITSISGVHSIAHGEPPCVVIPVVLKNKAFTLLWDTIIGIFKDSDWIRRLSIEFF